MLKVYDDLVRELKSLGWIADAWTSGEFLYITPKGSLSQSEGAYVEDTIAAYGYGYDNIWMYDFPQMGDIEIRLRPQQFSKQGAHKFGGIGTPVGLDSALKIEGIWERGVDALMRMNPSPECLRAIEAIQDAIRYDRFSDIADAVVTAWEYYGDMMYEQERENWAYHLVDPILDAINGSQSFSK